MAKKFTLGKTERLKSRKQIELLFLEGKKFSMTPFRVFYRFNEQESQTLQSGAGVSNRNFKKATDRNRIKRLVREAYRLQKITLEQKLEEKNSRLSIFFIYTGKELPVYKDVYLVIGKILDKLSRMVDTEK